MYFGAESIIVPMLDYANLRYDFLVESEFRQFVCLYMYSSGSCHYKSEDQRLSIPAVFVHLVALLQQKCAQ